MGKITEAEITSGSRFYLKKNNFNLISSSNMGEKLYYRTEINSKSLKQPDTVALKENLIIVFEDKINFIDLFMRRIGQYSDAKKLESFLENSECVNEFKIQVSKVVKINVSDLIVVGGFSAMNYNDELNKIKPEYVFIALEDLGGKLNVSNIKDANYPELFPVKNCIYNL